MSGNGMQRTSRTDWDRLNQMADEEIDYADIPPLTDEFFARARLVLPNAVELDPDGLDGSRNEDLIIRLALIRSFDSTSNCRSIKLRSIIPVAHLPHEPPSQCSHRLRHAPGSAPAALRGSPRRRGRAASLRCAV